MVVDRHHRGWPWWTRTIMTVWSWTGWGPGPVAAPGAVATPGLQPARSFPHRLRRIRSLQGSNPGSNAPGIGGYVVVPGGSHHGSELGSRYLPVSPETMKWSWGESNPRPSSGRRPRYDHSRDRRLTAAVPPGRLAHQGPPPGLSPGSAVFPAASGLSRRQPPLLLPGCGGQAPRAIAGRDRSRVTW